MSVSKEALRSYGNRLVGDLQVYLRSLHTHDVNNAIVVRARNALFRTLEEHFEEEPDTALHVQLLPEETFINGTLLPVAMADFGRILELTGQLRTIGVGEIVFLPGVTTDELSSFARAIFQCMHKRTPIDTRDFGQIRALELEYSAVGSAERDSPGGHLALHRTPRWTRRARGIGGGGAPTHDGSLHASHAPPHRPGTRASVCDPASLPREASGC